MIAHELGHVTGGHAVRLNGGAKEATAITILCLLLGVAAVAAGGGDAGMGIMSLGQQAAMGKFLAFTRAQELSADAAGAAYLGKAGIIGGAASSSSRSSRIRNFASRSTPRTAMTAPTRCRANASRR